MSPAEIQLRRDKGLCYFCDEKFSYTHKCPNKHQVLMLQLTDEDENPKQNTDPPDQSDKMDVKSIFCVDKLDEKESLMLFQKVAGMLDEKESLRLQMSIINQKIVYNYCAGLPMAIVMVGRALRGKSESVWKSTLEKLKNEELSGMQKSMEISVKMSYDHLESEELKSIFLLCAQMGHQLLIMDLVKYCFGLGILEGIYTIREAQNRIFTSIQQLKKLSLMMDGSSNDHLDMHDMVRDAALSIAYKEQHVFALRNGKLDDWPDMDKLEKCTSISIRNCDIIDELPEVLNCPQLKFFQIDSDDPSLHIPDKFFEGMKKLRVLILTGFHFLCLPSSIECLLNLRMLCLERCILHDSLSVVGKLKKLRILSFSGSQIENLPTELGCFDKLQLFDISNCSLTKMVPPNFISTLICLEELYIRKSLIKMEVHRETDQSQISFLSQLKHLRQLRVMDLYIRSAAVFPRDLFLDRLNDYKIVIGDFTILSVGDFRMPNKYEASRSLALHLTDGSDIHSQKGIKLLLKRVENLLLGELNGVKNVFCELNVDGFPDLKHLSIVNNIDIEYIFNTVKLSHRQAFPNLESLFLYKLRSIKTICYTLVTEASFTKLKIIKVKMCSQLKNLFPYYMVKFLASLETIDVSDCDSLEEIVFKEGGETSSNKVEFHKLRSLTLQWLPSLSRFYTNVVEGQTTNRDHTEITIAEDDHSVLDPLSLFGKQVEIPKLESLELSSISSHKIWSDQPLPSSCFQNLLKLTVKECHNLRYLCSLSMASNWKKLKVLSISECSMMERIFSTEGNNVEKVCVFPKLEEFRLTKLNMLTDIWQAEVSADSFSSLISVEIEECHKLDKIFPSHLTGWFQSLESLRLISCALVKFIFEIKNSQKKDASGSVTDTKLQLIHVEKLPTLTQVWDRDPEGILSFRNLQHIWVEACNQLRYVLPTSVAKDLKSLESIMVGICFEMEEIITWEDGSEAPLKFPEVNCMQLLYLPITRDFYRGGNIECPKLKQLSMVGCEQLKIFTMETNGEEKVISNLEIMEIDSKEALWLQGNHGEDLLHLLKDLHVWSLSIIEYLYWLLHRMPSLESLTLSFDKKIKELVPCRNIEPQERLGTILQLKKLCLQCSVIENLRLEQDPVLQRLEHLMLFSCDNLINLAPSSVSLTHLTYLEVNNCVGLTNLMASSTARSMVQLVTMKIIQCKLKEIVIGEENKEERVIEVVFSKLISLELVRLENLTSFSSYKNCEFKFPLLERLIVAECPKLETFTESHTTAPKLQSILAIEGEEEEKGYWEGDLNATVQKVFKDKVSFKYTEHLVFSHYGEMLQQVWDQNDLVRENMFCNLKTLKIVKCSDLVEAIPSHLLSCFDNLEELTVRNCSKVQVIFNINDMRVTKACGIFHLKKLNLTGLPNLKHVWAKDPIGIFSLQLLRKIRVNKCGTLKSLFPSSVAKDLTRLEMLKVTNCNELVEIFSKDEIFAEGATKEFVFPCLTSLKVTAVPALRHFYSGLHKVEFPLLETLYAYRSSLGILTCQADHPREQNIIQIDKVGPKQVDDLTSIGLEHSWLHPILENLQLIKVEHCDHLISLVLHTISFSNLTHLHVNNCKRLLYLFTSSTAKSLCRLKEMKIEECESMQEIVSKEGDESHEDENILFGELHTLFLIDLPKLSCFYSGIFALCFPSLKTVFVIGCSCMATFCPINTIDPTKLSSGVILTVDDDYDETQVQQWEEDLNSTLQKRFKEMVKEIEHLDLLYYPKLFEQWHRNDLVHENMFCNLKTLKIGKCSDLVEAIPSHLLPCFGSLEELEVSNCREVQVIFNINDTRVTKALGTFRLKKLSLYDLPNLEHVWDNDPIGIFCLSMLQEINVERCDTLKSLFPASVAKDLIRLEMLKVTNCKELAEIFSKDEISAEGATKEFVFPCLTLLRLTDLTGLKYFYRGLHKLEWPMLKELHAYHCNLVILNCQENHPGEQALIQIEKVIQIPSLEILSFGIGDTEVNWYRGFGKLQIKKLQNFQEESESVLYKLLVMLPRVLLHLKELELDGMENLKSIGLEHSWLHPVPENLQILDIQNCGLISLVPHTVSFSNLTRLQVFQCKRLLYLLTSSTAKSLCQLRDGDRTM